MKIEERAARTSDAEELAWIEHAARASDPAFDAHGIDLALLAQRWRTHLAANCLALGKSHDDATVIAIVDGRDVGVASFCIPVPPATRCQLRGIFVIAEFQRRGVGTFLLHALTEHLHALSVRELYIERCSHESGRMFCAKHSAVNVGGVLHWPDITQFKQPKTGMPLP